MILTNEQINAKIAELRGYTRAGVVYYYDKEFYVTKERCLTGIDYIEVQHWIDPVTHRTGALPDWAGSLDEAVTLKGDFERWSIEIGSHESGAYITIYNGVYVDGVEGFDKIFSRAVCLAWLKSQGVEVSE